MKRIISCILLFLMVACALLGCTNKVQSISLGEKITVGEFSFQIDAYHFTPFSSQVYDIFVECTFHNDSKKNVTPREKGPSISLNYDNGYEIHALEDTFTTAYYEKGFHTAGMVLYPGESMKYVMTARIPKAQCEDLDSSMVLSITFQGNDYKLVIR